MVITVKEIRGNCPVFNVGDRIVVESPKIVVEKQIILVFKASEKAKTS